MITASNPVRYLANTESLDPWGVTPGGQDVARSFGTKAQSLRDSISSKRPLLLNEIKTATGMSGQQLNSNVELQTYLNTLGATRQGMPAVLRAIQSLSNRFGTGELGESLQSEKYTPAIRPEKQGKSGEWSIRRKQ